MIAQTNARRVESLRGFSRAVSAAAIVVGCAVLLGWTLDVRILTTVFPGLASMKPLTALAFVVIGLTLWLHCRPAAKPERGGWSLAGSVFVALIGLLTIVEYILGSDLGIDRLLFRHAVEADEASFPGRMAPATALNFLLLGSAVLTTTLHRAPWGAQCLSLVAFVSSLLALTGYAYGASSLYGFGPYTSVALHTAVTFALLSLGVLFARADRGLMAIVTSDTVGGAISRRVLPAAVGVPILIGWMRVLGEEVGHYDLKIGTVLFALSNVIIFVGLILWSAAALTRTDGARLRAEQWVRLVMHASPHAMLLLDRGGRITLANAEAERLTGYSQAELLGRLMESLVQAPARSPDHGDGDKFLAGSAERPAGLGWDLHCRCKDGHDVPIDVGLNPIETGEGLMTLASLIDVTQRTRSEDRFRLAVEAAPNAMLLVAQDGTIELLNAQAETLFGYRRSELLGLPIEILLPARYRSQHPAHRQAYFSDLRARPMGAGRDLFGLRKDGREVAIEIGLNPIEMSDGLFTLASVIDITERKRAMQALSDSERRYRSIFRTAGVSIWEEDFTEVKAALDGLRAQGIRDFRRYFAEHPAFVEQAVGMVKILDVNDETVRMYEARDKSELLGSLHKIFEPETLAVFVEELLVITAGQTFFQSEAVVRTLQGRRFDILLTIHFPASTESFGRVLVCLMEITELRRALLSLSASEARFRALVDASAQIVWTTDPEGSVVEDSPSWRAFTGQTFEQWRGWGWLDAFHPNDRDRVGKLWREAVATKTPVSTEYRIRHVSGGWRWTAVRAVPLLDADGSVSGWVGMNTDITERKQTELELQQARNELELRVLERTEDLEKANAALRQSQTRFRQMVEHSPTAMLMVAASGKIMLVNSQIESMFGFSRSELIGQPVEALIPARFHERHVRYRNDFQANPQPLRTGVNHELFGLRHDGTEFSIEIGLNPIETLEGPCTLVAVLDITERKHVEEELKLTAAELERSNADLEQFASAASHDLQEPLRTVSSYLDLLSGRYQNELDDKARQWIETAMNGASRMKQLVHDLLEYSRVGSHGETFRPVDCNTVFDMAVAGLQTRIEETEATVTRGPLPTVSGDRTQLTRVFQNLIGNAVKFHGSQPPTVQVSAEAQDGEWVFTVRDNGIGIDPKFFERVFQIFQRLHTISEYPGTGIGLAMCRRIVERHGGRIWVESQPGQGTTFFFTLPHAKPVTV